MSITAMGFDFGTKRIGVATGQNLTGTAQGIATVGNNGKNGPWNEIEGLIHQWQPDMLVVGLPLDKEGGVKPPSALRPVNSVRNWPPDSAAQSTTLMKH